MTLNFGIPLSREGEIIEKDPNEIPKEKINIPPAQNLFLTKPDFISSFDFRDVLRGQAYLKFYGGLSRSEAESEQEAYDTGNDGELEMDDAGEWYAQTFEVSTDMWVTKVAIYMDLVDSSATRDPIMYITRVDGSNLPTMDEPMASTTSDTTVNSWVTPKWYEFTMDQNFVKLKAGVKYALVVDGKGSGGGTGTTWKADISSPNYSNGNVCKSTNYGDSWSADTGKDAMFRIYGVSVNPFILFPEQFDSDVTSTAAPLYRPETTDGTFFKRQDIDFDLKVGVTMVLEGKAIIEFTTQDNEGENDASYYNIIKLKKDDGTTETTLATGQGRTHNMANATNERRQSVILDITTKTKIVKGDIIRLSIETWVESDGDLTTLNLFHDPTSRVTYSIDIVSNDGEDSNSGKKSDLTIFLPFKV